MGAVTPLGKNLSLMFPRLLEGDSAIAPIHNPEAYKDIPVRIAAQVDRDPESPDAFGLQDWHEGNVSDGASDAGRRCAVSLPSLYACKCVPQVRKQLPDSIQFALGAARDALEDAKWRPTSDAECERTVC